MRINSMKKNPRDDPNLLAKNKLFEKNIKVLVNSIIRFLNNIDLNCDQEFIKDIVLESIINAWYNNINYIGYCIGEYDKIAICLVQHIIWISNLYLFNKIKDLIIVIMPADKRLTEDLFPIIKKSIHIIKSKNTVLFIINNIDKFIIDSIKNKLKNISCTNIFYTLFDTLDIEYGEY